MQTLIIEIESDSKAKALIATLQEHENVKSSIVKRKNKAIAKYL